MKVISELIEYLLSKSQLNEEEYGWLVMNGFFVPDPKKGDLYLIPRKEFTDYDDTAHQKRAPDWTINDSDLPDYDHLYEDLKKIGKGKKSARTSKRLTLEDINTLILQILSDEKHCFKSLYALINKNKEVASQLLMAHEEIDDTVVKEQLWKLFFLYQTPYDAIEGLYEAVFDASFFDEMWKKTEKLSPRNREYARNILRSWEPIQVDDQLNGFRLAARLFRLRRIVLEWWHQWNLDLISHSHREVYYLENYPLLIPTFVLLENIALKQPAEEAIDWFICDELVRATEIIGLFFPIKGIEIVKFLSAKYKKKYIVHDLPNIELLSDEQAKKFAILRPPDWLKNMQNENYHKYWFWETSRYTFTENKVQLDVSWFNIVDFSALKLEYDHKNSTMFFSMIKEDFVGLFVDVFEDVKTCSEGLIQVYKNGEWGFLNKKGFWAIPPQYQEVTPFSEGFSVVRKGGDEDLFHYIDRNNNRIGDNNVKKISFHLAKPFSEGIADCYSDEPNLKSLLLFKEGWKVKTKSFEDFFEPIAPGIYPKDTRGFHEGLAAVNFKASYYHWAYVNKSGKLITTAEYEDAWNFREGRAAVQKNGLWGFIDPDGKEVVPCQYKWAWSFSEGRAAVMLGEDQWNWIDPNGKLISQVNYKMAAHFANGWAGYHDGEIWNFADTDGQPWPQALPEKSFTTAGFSENLCTLSFEKKEIQSILRKEGWYTNLPNKYAQIFSFSEGLAAAKKMTSDSKIHRRLASRGGISKPLEYRYGFIDSEFHERTNFNFLDVRFFKKGLNAFDDGRTEDFHARVNTGFEPYTLRAEWAFSDDIAGVHTEDGKWRILFRLRISKKNKEQDWVIIKQGNNDYLLKRKSNNQCFRMNIYKPHCFVEKNSLLIENPANGLFAIMDVEASANLLKPDRWYPKRYPYR